MGSVGHSEYEEREQVACLDTHIEREGWNLAWFRSRLCCPCYQQLLGLIPAVAIWALGLGKAAVR
jgi:hypothetical protein